MNFVSLTFFVFLTIVFTLYWLIRRRFAQNVLLVVASYVFYGWWDWRFCSLLLASSLIDYVVGLALARREGRTARRVLLGVSLLANLGLLGTFKYFNFFAESLQASLNALGWEVRPIDLYIILPVGISFYTFQSLSYTIDVYRRQIGATPRIVDYLAYVSFFPQLVAGPIERATSLLPQFEEPRTFVDARARDGLRQMLWGFFKKMVLADNLATLVDPVYADPGAQTGPVLAFATACFAIQVYCDFSGYSDIAIGTAKLFGIRLRRNFAYPFFAQTMGEFWRRWHISLATWFRDYVYIPLGGNRTGPLRHAWNVFLTFVICGFWHGAAWTYLIWGAVNGLQVLPELFTKGRKIKVSDTPGGEGLLPGPLVLLRMVRTFVLFCLALTIFRALSVSDAVLILERYFTDVWTVEAYAPLREMAFEDEGQECLIHIAILFIAEWLQRRRYHPLDMPEVPRPLRWLIYTVLIWDIMYIGTKSSGTFIYFQF